jgi:hypothetical protein
MFYKVGERVRLIEHSGERVVEVREIRSGDYVVKCLNTPGVFIARPWELKPLH